MDFQTTIATLDAFWRAHGCAILQPYDVEKGAATLGPQTFLRALGRRPWAVAYVDPCRRPTDSRYARADADRYQRYYQYQVLLKPTLAEDTARTVFTESLRSLGLDPAAHDLEFRDDAWESPVFGARGAGWEVWLDGAEIAQLTWFDECGGIECPDRPLEITYGLERLGTVLQGVPAFADLRWDERLGYGDLHRDAEVEFSVYNVEAADVGLLSRRLGLYAEEVDLLVEQGLVHPALDILLKWAQTFNTLDARKALPTSMHRRLVEEARARATRIGRAYMRRLDQQEAVAPDVHRT